MSDIKSMIEIKKNYETKWLLNPDIHAVGIGYKTVGNVKTGDIGIVVYTTKKKKLEAIPQAERIPASVEGVLVDVVESPKFEFLGDNASTKNKYINDDNLYRPMPGGIQLMHLGEQNGNVITLYFGTLGMFVKSNDDPDSLYILSNWHVLQEIGMDLYQPTYAGKEESMFLVARTTKGAYYKTADAGIAKVLLSKDQVQPNNILEIGSIRGICEEPIQLDQLVKKRGRTTGLTHGKVISIETTVSSGENEYEKQIFIEGIDDDGLFCSGGDSGSVVLSYDDEIEENNNLVAGLLWGAAADGNIGVFSPIGEVFDALDITLCDGDI
jgi:hypothetical protein